jgi:hypothetical protein
MPFTRKSSAPVQRIEGEYPELPKGNKLGLDSWWLDTKVVLDRVRDKIGEIEATAGQQGPAGPAGKAGVDGIGATAEELKATLLIEGDAVGTLNEMEIENKVLGGGSF